MELYSEYLVRASDPLAVQTNSPGTFSCNRNRCYTCKYVTLDNLLQIQGPRKSFRVNDHFTCISTNVVYIIACKRCKLLYIGETKRRLADRVAEHLRSIRLHLPGFPIATHFNPPSPCNISDFAVTGALLCKGNDFDRLKSENRLIFELGTLSPDGLNVKFDVC